MDILLVDDHRATREEMVSLLEDQDDIDVVGQADNGLDGIRLAEKLHPDLILMDIVMPQVNGIIASEKIRKSCPETRIIALSNHTGENIVEAVFHAGASGYVRKDRAYEELLPAIRAVAQGHEYIGKHVDD